MSRRLLVIVIIGTMIGIPMMNDAQSEAASFSSGKIAQLRNARLLKRKLLIIGRDTTSHSSVSSLPYVSWEAFRLSKRRGGGGSGQRTMASSSSASSLVTPMITFNAITKNYGDTSFTPSLTSDSNGAFTFESSNTSVATVGGNTITIVAAGTTTITAMQAASGNYEPRTVAANLTVNPITPTITALITITKSSTDPPFDLSDPTSNSAGVFSFTSTNTGIATVSGRTVTLVGPGTTTIISTQAASGNYKSGSGTTTLNVSPIDNESA